MTLPPHPYIHLLLNAYVKNRNLNMFRETPFVDVENSGKLILDTRAATSSVLLMQGTVAVGIQYTWQRINWQQVLHMSSLQIGSAGYRVEHEAVSAVSQEFQIAGHNPITQAGAAVGLATSLISSTMDNSTYCPNSYGVQGVFNNYEVDNEFMQFLGFGVVWMLNIKAKKAVFYMKNPETHTDVSLRMFMPVATTGYTYALPPNDLTSSVHIFTFTSIKE